MESMAYRVSERLSFLLTWRLIAFFRPGTKPAVLWNIVSRKGAPRSRVNKSAFLGVDTQETQNHSGNKRATLVLS